MAAKCRTWGLTPIIYPHILYGGATTGIHLVAFGPGIGRNWSSFSHPADVRRSLTHFWHSAANTRYRSCSTKIASFAGNHERVLRVTAGGVSAVRLQGLLPTYNSTTFVVGPCAFLRDALVVRRLTCKELLRIFDVPLALDSSFLSKPWPASVPLPFVTSISANIVTKIFRHLWMEPGGVPSTPLTSSGGALASAVAHAPAQDDDDDDISDCPSRAKSSIESVIPAAISIETDRPSVDSSAQTANTSHSPPSIWGSEPVPAAHTQIPVTCEVPGEISVFENSWDSESDDDSLMPRNLHCIKEKGISAWTWEFLEEDLPPLPNTSTATKSTVSESTVASSLLETGSMGSSTSNSVSSFDAASEASEQTLQTAVTRLTLASHDTASTYATADTRWENVSYEDDSVSSKEVQSKIKFETIGQKATKADDAEVPVYLWNRRIIGENPEEAKVKAMSGYRIFGLRLFWRALKNDCIDVLRKKFGPDWMSLPRKGVDGNLTRVGKEVDAIKNLLWHATEASWFEYHSGSRIYHFRFPLRYQKIARDGVPIFFEKPGPSTMRPQPKFTDSEVRDKVRPKVEKVIKRRYMVRTGIKLKSLIKYFAVPKGETDIRIVYDATASGFNECVWAPSFWLPTIDSLVRALDADSWMSDRDIGDMFLNFQLHKSAWPFAGVDIKPLYDENGDVSFARWYHWVRNAMGFGPSPYNSIKLALIAEEVIKGDRHDPNNPFSWACVQLNLPGSIDYDPEISWIRKVRDDLLSACELFTFVDDERVKGATRELTWQASHRLAAVQSYLGIQDAARKVGECLQQPRAWAGAVVHVIPDKGIYVLTSDEKWLKMKRIIAKWSDVLDSGASNLDHKQLLSDRGFLVYVTRAYPSLIPYVKGFHLTAEMWRGNRDADGWKLPVTERQGAQESRSEVKDSVDDDDAVLDHRLRHAKQTVPRAPSTGLTPPAPRLRDDLKALAYLTQSESPPLRMVRPKNVYQVFYGFGDASGKGRGSTFQGFKTVHHPSGHLGPSTDVIYRVGIWGSDAEDESSNYRELRNLVEDFESEAESGRMRNTEAFLCTDNATAESAFYKGSSSSKLLHDLVLRLHMVALKYSIILHVIHIAGTRMIAQGTDGCSRGVLLEGVMAGHDMLSFLDLNKTAFERYLPLLWWIRSWCPNSRIFHLTPEEWFEKGHGIVGGHLDKHGVWMPDHEKGGSVHLWAPPPAVADAALEELAKARHKRTDTYHIVVVPRLFSPKWRRLFHKVCDMNFVIPPGASFWPSDMYEPLWVGIIFPFIPHRPWCLKRAPLMVELGRQLCEVCKERDFLGGHILRKLFKLTGRLASLPSSVARGLLHVPRSGFISNGHARR